MKTTETDAVGTISYNISETSALTKIRESEVETYTTKLQTPVTPSPYEIRYHIGTASTSELAEEGVTEASGFDLRLTEEEGLLKITLVRTSRDKTNSEVARQQLENLFRGHEEVIFEDGMESDSPERYTAKRVLKLLVQSVADGLIDAEALNKKNPGLMRKVEAYR